MFQQLMRYDSDWRSHHRRYMDEPSPVKQFVAITITLGALILFLMLMPWSM